MERRKPRKKKKNNRAIDKRKKKKWCCGPSLRCECACTISIFVHAWARLPCPETQLMHMVVVFVCGKTVWIVAPHGPHIRFAFSIQIADTWFLLLWFRTGRLLFAVFQFCFAVNTSLKLFILSLLSIYWFAKCIYVQCARKPIIYNNVNINRQTTEPTGSSVRARVATTYIYFYPPRIYSTTKIYN